MKHLSTETIAAAAAAAIIRDAAAEGPARVVIKSAEAGPGALFVGLPGARAHGGSHAAAALNSGAWGVLSTPEYARQALEQSTSGVVLASDDPLKALQRLATFWRREIGAQVIGVTGSTGKTSTKDLLDAILSPQLPTVVSQANYNTEIGLPLQILGAPAGTKVLVLEMGMRGRGQIAELCEIAEPDVGVIVSIGAVHLELLGTIENIAAAKAELLAALAPGATAIVPADSELLAPYLREDLRILRFGRGADVRITAEHDMSLDLDLDGTPLHVEVNFAQAHMRTNLLAAVAAAAAVGVTPRGRIDLALTPGRGQLIALGGGVTLLDGSYNGNPDSMRAALTELDATAKRAGARAGGGSSRRVAVLGDMLELGPDAPRFHREIGSYAGERADLLVTIGPLAANMNGMFAAENHHVDDAGAAAELLPTLLRSGDLVLVKGSLGVGLKHVCDALIEVLGTAADSGGRA